MKTVHLSCFHWQKSLNLIIVENCSCIHACGGAFYVITALGELCCVVLSFCCVVLPCLLSEHLMDD